MTKNISDYLRDFPARANAFVHKERKSIFFLALNVILNIQSDKNVIEKIKDNQEKLETYLGVKHEHDPYEDGLFIYPKETLHFSILSFYKTFPTTEFKTSKDFSTFQDKINERNDYKSFQKSIKSLLSKSISKKSKIFEADIRWLFTGTEPKYKQDGFSLQIYPEKSFLELVSKLFTETKGLYKKEGFNSDSLNFKGYPEKPKTDFFRFVVNIGRFINYDDHITNEISTKAINYTEEFNREDDHNPRITFEINKLTLVESDSWLYNAVGKKHILEEFPL